MYYEVEWSEGGVQKSRCVFVAKDLGTLWKSIKYLNWERDEEKRPLMKKVRITELINYEGDYLEVTGNYQPGISADVDALNESGEPS